MGQNLYLRIQSNDEKETKLLDSIYFTKTHKDYYTLEQELNTLKAKLNRLGYIDAEWNVLKKLNDSVFESNVTLKKPYKYIHIYYNVSQLPTSTIRQLRKDKSKAFFIVNFQQIEKTLQFINQQISEKGFPFNKAKLENIQKKEGSTLKANLVISEQNHKRYIDKILVKGYEKFPKSYLKQYLKLKNGAPINLAKVKQQTNLLQELPFANQIKEPEILFSRESTILYVYIEKTKSNSFDGFLGFGTDEATSKLALTGYLNLELTNNLNYGETLSIAYRSDESEQKSFAANLKLPYLFSTPIGAEFELSIFKKDSSFTTAQQSARINYLLNSKNQFSIGLKSTKSNNLLSNDNLNPFIRDYTTTFYNARYLYTHHLKNRPLFKRNAQVRLETGFGNRATKEERQRQLHFELDAFKIFNLNLKNNVYLKASSYGLFSNTYLENELSRFGGINSIRGFEENSLNASFYALLASEYRYSLSPNLYVHSIIDVAYFENKIINQKTKLYSFGFGFGLNTKAGLLRFNYANGKSEERIFKFSNSKIHISLTAAF
ncbi:hypothetical protein BZARG_885 [Bizionia argentinensis JUB59]|uniref:POTRA domain-containing protein n=1 Tax=Bizionia argentinensis JUB59 TaxID=1046627 RepID=G2EBK6_9FLAO|nr:POTRA domain-containing protein [Bizionia argentinensis]EGV44156.1 hypothetical protein BZARG_885 [Bizionia argentinensis JUB59]